MATVAHEGNPRTNSLVVTGTLDGDIFLAASPVPSAPTPTPVDPAPAQLYLPSSNSPFKYVIPELWAFGTDSNDSAATTQQTLSAEVNTDTFIAHHEAILEYSQKDGLKMWGLIRSPRVRTNLKVVDVDKSHLEIVFDFLTFQDTYGMINQPWNTRWKKPPIAASYSTVAQHARAFVNQAIEGFPFSGVAVGVHPDSTFDNFTGVVSAYNWANQTQYLMTYRNQSLATFGTILTSSDARGLLGVDDNVAVRISYLISTGAYTFLDNINTASSLTEADLPYFSSDMRAALINIAPTAHSGTDDAVSWKQVSSTIFIS